MAGPFAIRGAFACRKELFRLPCVGVYGRQSVGKFFLFIVAMSVAILLAMSTYVISL